jgi:hypothetical protein
MSGFFSDLGGTIKNPDVVMNSGPLPSQDSGGWPVGFNGIPDGKIGMAPSLLGGVQPYSYGGPDRLSTQAAYLNIPHVTQRLVPSISIPRTHVGTGMFQLNHQIDDGDIAFVIRCMFSPYEMIKDKKKYGRQGVLHAIDPVVNLATVNYLLHCIQQYGFLSTYPEWNTLWVVMGVQDRFPELSETMTNLDDRSETATEKAERTWALYHLGVCRRLVVDYLVKEVMKPFGIPRGSEKQGGQHQGLVNKYVTWPVDLVTSMVIDGRVINMVNFWRREDVHAGDDLLLYVKSTSDRDYVLSHHPTSVYNHRFDDFTDKAKAVVIPTLPTRQNGLSNWNSWPIIQRNYEQGLVDAKIRTYAKLPKMWDKFPKRALPLFQLYPGVSSSSDPLVQKAVWNEGYWHIARSQVMQYQYDISRNCHTMATNLLRGNLMQATFEPTWMDPLIPDPSRHRKRRRQELIPTLELGPKDTGALTDTL